MNKTVIRLCLVGLLTAGITGTSVQLRAQDKNQPAAESKAPRKRPEVTPFHGKLKAVDESAKTISVHSLTIQISPETRIDKGGAPAALSDGVAGEIVSGGYKKSADGGLVATTVHFGPREPKSSSRKSAARNKSQEPD